MKVCDWKFNLRWVPHKLDANDETERRARSEDLLQILEECQQNGFLALLTGDESWFLFAYSEFGVWAASRDEVPDEVRTKVIRKCMISLIWGVAGIQSLIAVPKGMKYNTEFFCQQFVPDLKSNICSGARRRILKGYLIHLENAAAHNSRSSNECLEATNARRVPHPAYSPDLAPSDFFLFGFLKEKFRRIAHPDDEDLISRGQAIFNEIRESVLILVDMTWIKRFRWVLKNKCEYYSKWKKKIGFW